MAWWCSGSSNNELVDNMLKKKIIKSERIADTMKSVDRRNFTKEPDGAYKDSPQPIGYQATISAPHMHAIALQLVESRIPPTDCKVLDVGCGSGYLTACLAKMAGETGRVIGIDHIPELVEWAEQNVRTDCPELLESGRVRLVTGDGREGVPGEAPYNVIHVGAAAPELPAPLVDQLAIGGRLVIPIGTKWGEQCLEVIDKISEAEVVRKRAMPVKFVPLTDKDSQVIA